MLYKILLNEMYGVEKEDEQIKKEEGWYQIKLGKDQTGWVYQKYAKEI